MSDRDVAARLSALHRYTITSEGASPGYFRLVEDPDGCWVQWPEVAGLLTALPRQFVEQQEDTDHTRVDSPSQIGGSDLPQRAPVPDSTPVENKEFNLNSSVWVKLQPNGRALLEQPIYPGLASRLSHLKEIDGWSKWQLWDLMNTFGEHIYMGGTPPFETTIRMHDGPHPDAEIAVARIDGTQQEK